MKLTGETITDEQIRELLGSVNTIEMYAGHTVATLCRAALGELHLHGSTTHYARARCAEILNARAQRKS